MKSNILADRETFEKIAANRNATKTERYNAILKIKEHKPYKDLNIGIEEYCSKYLGISKSLFYKIASHRINTPNRIKPSLRWDIWERDNFTCTYCGVRRYLCVDHIVPACKGGNEDPSNLITSCVSCNSKKGKKIL